MKRHARQWADRWRSAEPRGAFTRCAPIDEPDQPDAASLDDHVTVKLPPSVDASPGLAPALDDDAPA